MVGTQREGAEEPHVVFGVGLGQQRFLSSLGVLEAVWDKSMGSCSPVVQFWSVCPGVPPLSMRSSGRQEGFPWGFVRHP